MASLTMKHTLIMFFALFAMVTLFLPHYETMAQSPTPTPVPFPPYDSVKIWMYHLSDVGDTLRDGDDNPIKCILKDKSYGCTAIPNNNNLAYPFLENPVTLKLESDIRNGHQQGYIHNVTAEELGLHIGSQGNKPFASVQAQAIAALFFINHITIPYIKSS